MAVAQDLIERVRRYIGDIGSTETYTDSILEGYILDGVAEIQGLAPGGFTADSSANTISPSPAYSNPYHTLFGLQAAIDLLNGQWGNNARKALSVRSGSVSLNTSVGLGASKNVVSDLVKRRDALIVKVKAEGLGSEGNVWDANQLVELAPTYEEFKADIAPSTHIVIDIEG